MILKDIADITGLDVFNDITGFNSKYVQTWFEYMLKGFTAVCKRQVREEVSTGELKNMLKKLVDDEDKKKPLTDDELVIFDGEGRLSDSPENGYQIQAMLDIPVGPD